MMNERTILLERLLQEATIAQDTGVLLGDDLDDALADLKVHNRPPVTPGERAPLLETLFEEATNAHANGYTLTPELRNILQRLRD